MIMAGDEIRIRIFNDPEHHHEVITANRDRTLEVYEKTGVAGYGDESVLGVDWIREDGETVFTPLDDFGEVLVEMERVNPMPIDIEFDEFVRLYAANDEEIISPAEKLRRSLIRAGHAALAAIGDGGDGGTCNFDAPAIDFAACGLSKAATVKIIKEAGLDCYDWKPFRSHRENGKLVKAPTYLVITGFQRGQADLRTRMSRAFCNRLNIDGIESGMYYQMD